MIQPVKEFIVNSPGHNLAMASDGNASVVSLCHCVSVYGSYCCGGFTVWFAGSGEGLVWWCHAGQGGG